MGASPHHHTSCSELTKVSQVIKDYPFPSVTEWRRCLAVRQQPPSFYLQKKSWISLIAPRILKCRIVVCFREFSSSFSLVIVISKQVYLMEVEKKQRISSTGKKVSLKFDLTNDLLLVPLLGCVVLSDFILYESRVPSSSLSSCLLGNYFKICVYWEQWITSNTKHPKCPFQSSVINGRLITALHITNSSHSHCVNLKYYV